MTGQDVPPSDEALQQTLSLSTQAIESFLSPSEIKTCRERAQEMYKQMDTPGTTVYAVAHARDPNADQGSAYDSEAVLKAAEAILPRQLEALTAAVTVSKEDV